MKNVVECYKELFGYFNALETNSRGLYSGLNAKLKIQILNGVYSGPLLLMARVKDKCNLNSVGAIFPSIP